MKNYRTRSAEEIAQAAEYAAAIPDHALLTTPEASEFLRALGKSMTPETLRVYRHQKPHVLPFFRSGRSASYRAADLRAFALGEA